MMFTPQKKVWSGWLSPRDNNNNSNPNLSPKDKGFAIGDSTPKALVSNVGIMDRDVVIDRINKLEKELYEYQYNMGLLLIEKKEWVSKNEQIEQALEETKELLQREQTAHLIAMSEVEKREEKLRKALGVEKQCVHELEKALREMRSEYAEIKFTADSKLEEAHALSASVEGRSLEVEAKLRAAEAKLAEVSRKSSEIQRKAAEIEAKESSLMRERMSFNNERDAHERSLSHQREDLREWETKLQEGEEKLVELRRLINQREELANENDKIFKQKQIDLEDAQKKIEAANSDLKTKEIDISTRMKNLASKEKETVAMRKNLEKKEKELLELEEKLNVREKVEIQKLLDEHKAILDTKTHDFELEMEQKRKSLDEDFRIKVADVEKKEAEVNHLEGKIVKREEALEKKLEKIKEKEKDVAVKSKALKEKEKSLKDEEKNLEKERKELSSEKENLLNLKTELEKLSAEIEEQRLEVTQERERLQVTEEERTKFVRLQLELKQEIEKTTQERELIGMERENLKQEKEKFEREWEELDEKRAEIKEELESIAIQKEKMEKLNRLEQEKLKNMRLETESYVESELESLKLAKESFAANMEHEKSVLSEKYSSKESQMIHDFEVKKQELETELRNKEMEFENRMCEREKTFVEERERELENVKYLREVASREMKEMKLERTRLEKEKQDVFANQKHLEGQQRDMKRDIDDLVGLSVKLKDQREQFINERERFVAFVEKLKGCTGCGEIVSEFVLVDLKSLTEVKHTDNFSLPKLADGYLKEAVQVTSENNKLNVGTSMGNLGSPGSGSRTLNWLKKCTSIFSAGKKKENEADETETEAQENVVDIGEIPEYIVSSEDEPEVSARITQDSFDVQRQVDQSADDDVKHINSQKREIEEVSQQPDGNEGQSKSIKRLRARTTRSRVTETSNGVAKHSVSQGVSTKGGSRKRASEQEPEYSEQHDSVTNGPHRNRRRKVVRDVEPPKVKRYNLRRSKTGATSTAGDGTLSTQSTENVVGRKRRVPGSKAQPGASTSIDNGEHAGESQVSKEIVDGENEVANTLPEDMALSEEVNGTPQQVRENDNDEHEIGTPGAQNQEEEDDDGDGDSEDEEFEHPGEVSIGRKLWTFIST
ncbi:hypothetical protein QVD17_36773 [Tagetes erecta]|uniref:Nuclear matrix constituent protein 1-like protein n=1 Tax=Tagetes erecta TaxID=13708 RepID=A0AAD8NJH2_TARER|nr:hypothetical protein QVD17_36773 [Tagetes erecta]